MTSPVRERHRDDFRPTAIVLSLISVAMCVVLLCDVLPLVRWFLDVQWPT